MRCIYKIINIVNNKFYVGSAVDFTKRKSRHIWRLRRGDHANKHLQAAWNKYGESSFVFAIVEKVPKDKNLLVIENIWLKKHVGKEYCYNIATDAIAPQLGMKGEKSAMWRRTFKHSELAKAKIAAASSARIQSEEEKAKRRATMIGKPRPLEVRQKISATLSGDGNYWRGKKRPEHGEKVSKPIIAIDPHGNETQYPSILTLLTNLGLKPPTVHRALKANRALCQGPYIGWAFKYVDPPASA